MVHETKDLTPAERAAAELLLGRPLTDEETISVQAFNAIPISDEQRRHVTAELRRLFAEVDQSLQSATDPDTERLFTEAMRSSRPGYRSRSRRLRSTQPFLYAHFWTAEDPRNASWCAFWKQGNLLFS